MISLQCKGLSSVFSNTTVQKHQFFGAQPLWFRSHIHKYWASLVVQRVKRLPAMRETWVRSLGKEYPLEKEMPTHSSTLAWIIPWTEKPGGLQSTEWQRVRHDSTTSLSLLHFHALEKAMAPTPVLLPGESHGRRSLLGCSPRGG